MFGRKKRDEEIAGKVADELQAPYGIDTYDLAGLRSEEKAIDTLSKLFDVYQPGVIFSEPISVGDTTVITASEVYVGMGLGFGHGSGGSGDEGGEGGGGGGGGASAGRPTAAIIIEPKGVRVEPIVDVTKISLAFITMLGALFMAWRAMRRKR